MVSKFGAGPAEHHQQNQLVDSPLSPGGSLLRDQLWRLPQHVLTAWWLCDTQRKWHLRYLTNPAKEGFGECDWKEGSYICGVWSNYLYRQQAHIGLNGIWIDPQQMRSFAKLKPLFTCWIAAWLLVGSQGRRARHLTWKWLYCNNVITFYWPSISTSGERGLLGDWDECALCHFWIISCLQGRCEPWLSEPPGRGGLCVGAVLLCVQRSWGLPGWKVLVENYKAISEEMLSMYLNQDIWAFIFACATYPWAFWSTDSH